MTEHNHMAPEQLLNYLDELGIAHTTVEHPPVFTVEEAKRLRGRLTGGNCKSLFLKNKKGQMWLVVAPEDHRIDLDALAVSLGSNRLSFGSPQRLLAHLGVIPGAVTPLAVFNDHAGAVAVAIYADLLVHEQLNFHPLVNYQTTAISTTDLLRFLEVTGHPPLVLESADAGKLEKPA